MEHHFTLRQANFYSYGNGSERGFVLEGDKNILINAMC